MIKVIEGSTHEVITEMKQLKAAAAAAAKPVFRSYTAKEIEHGVPSDTAKFLIKVHNHRQLWYKTTYYTPAYLEGVMVDYRSLSKFLRHMRGFTLELEVSRGALKLHYVKGSHTTRQSGYLLLYDLSEYYSDLTKVPTIKIEEAKIK